MVEKAKWDAEVADKKAEEFGATLGAIEAKHSEAIAELRQAWKDAYMVSGHKRLARALLAGGV